MNNNSTDNYNNALTRGTSTTILNDEKKYYTTTPNPDNNVNSYNKPDPLQQNSSLTLHVPEDVPEHHDVINSTSQSSHGDNDEHSTTTSDVTFGRRERLFIVFLSCIAIMASALPVQIYYPSLVSIEKVSFYKQYCLYLIIFCCHENSKY